MKHAVLGPGAVGGLLGGALARSGQAVIFIVRPGAAERYPNKVYVESRVLGDFEVEVEVASELTVAVDVLWVTVKAHQLMPALERVISTPQHIGLVIPLLNGLGHVGPLVDRFGGTRVMPGSISVESERTMPGRFRQLSPFIQVELGSSEAQWAQGEKVSAELRAAGLSCNLRTDSLGVLWRKLAFLMPLALTTTASGMRIGEVRADPTWRQLLTGCMQEMCSVAQASGVRIDQDEVVHRFMTLPSEMGSSMQKDLDSGRTLELDALIGPVLEQAKEEHVSVKITVDLAHSVRSRYASMRA